MGYYPTIEDPNKKKRGEPQISQAPDPYAEQKRKEAEAAERERQKAERERQQGSGNAEPPGQAGQAETRQMPTSGASAGLPQGNAVTGQGYQLDPGAASFVGDHVAPWLEAQQNEESEHQARSGTMPQTPPPAPPPAKVPTLPGNDDERARLVAAIQAALAKGDLKTAMVLRAQLDALDASSGANRVHGDDGDGADGSDGNLVEPDGVGTIVSDDEEDDNDPSFAAQLAELEGRLADAMRRHDAHDVAFYRARIDALKAKNDPDEIGDEDPEVVHPPGWTPPPGPPPTEDELSDAIDRFNMAYLDPNASNTDEEEAYINRRVLQMLGQQQVEQRARMGRAGFGASGALAAMEGDQMRAANLDAQGQIYDVREREQNQAYEHGIGAQGAETQRQQAENEAAILGLKVDLAKGLAGIVTKPGDTGSDGKLVGDTNDDGTVSQNEMMAYWQAHPEDYKKWWEQTFDKPFNDEGPPPTSPSGNEIHDEDGDGIDDRTGASANYDTKPVAAADKAQAQDWSPGMPLIGSYVGSDGNYDYIQGVDGEIWRVPISR